MNLSDFDFELPTDLIAQHPLSKRDASRMLVVSDKIYDKQFTDFFDFIKPGDVIVFNLSLIHISCT